MALAALLTGFVLGALRFVVELGVKAETPWVTWGPLVEVAGINFLHFAIVLFVVSLLILLVVSPITSKPTEKNLSVFAAAPAAPGQAATAAGRRSLNVVLSILLVVIVLILWAYFSPWFFGGAPL